MRIDGVPFPEPVSTSLRCQFGLSGHRYNCRCVGKYLLHGKRYCAPHYRTAWLVANPVFGQAHDWRLWRDLVCCRRCGATKVHEGLPQEPCKGRMPQIRLW